MKDIKAKIEKAGVIVLADAWLAGAVASKKGCIRKPDDIKGQKVRSRRPDLRGHVAAGRRLDRVDPVERGLQRPADRRRRGDRHLDRQLRLVPPLRAGQVHHGAGRQRPVVHVRAGADLQEELRQARQEEQQEALVAAGKKSEAYFNDATKKLDDEMVASFKKNNVEVVSLTPEEYDAWIKIAQESSYKLFADEVSDGKKLIDAALAVK